MNQNRENISLYRLFGSLSVLALTWLAWNLHNPENEIPGCLFHHVTGIPCPSCGITHSMMDIVQFRFTEAAKDNILGFPATAMLAVVPFLIITDSVFRKNYFIRCYRGMEAFLQKHLLFTTLLVLLILINWFYLIVKN